MKTALRSLAPLALASLTLAGCISLFPKTKPSQLYRFGAPAMATAPTTPAAGSFAVRLAPIGFPVAAAADRILTVSGEQVAYVSGGRWVTAAATLFEAAVTQTFDTRGGPARLLARGELAPRFPGPEARRPPFRGAIRAGRRFRAGGPGPGLRRPRQPRRRHPAPAAHLHRTRPRERQPHGAHRRGLRPGGRQGLRRGGGLGEYARRVNPVRLPHALGAESGPTQSLRRVASGPRLSFNSPPDRRRQPSSERPNRIE